MDLMRAADRLWPVFNRVGQGHVALYRATDGRVGSRVPGMGPMLLLEHVGARSGVTRTTPLIYVADGDDVVVVASKGGHPKHPAWFHNLRANPDTTVQVGPERRAVRAREAEPQERDRLWTKAVETYGGYEGYQRRAGREIPLVVLERRPG